MKIIKIRNENAKNIKNTEATKLCFAVKYSLILIRI